MRFEAIKEALELQATFARSNFEKAMAQTGQLTEASFKLAEQAIEPLRLASPSPPRASRPRNPARAYAPLRGNTTMVARGKPPRAIFRSPKNPVLSMWLNGANRMAELAHGQNGRSEPAKGGTGPAGGSRLGWHLDRHTQAEAEAPSVTVRLLVGTAEMSRSGPEGAHFDQRRPEGRSEMTATRSNLTVEADAINRPGQHVRNP